MSAKKKLYHSIYLIRAGKTTDDVVRESVYRNRDEEVYVEEQEIEVSEEVKGILYFAKLKEKAPVWVDEFLVPLKDNDNFQASSLSAVLLVPVVVPEPKKEGKGNEEETVTRLFALTFGNGRNLLEPSCVEKQFGLKVVLNLASPDRFRRIDRRTIAGKVRHINEQLSEASPIVDFLFDPYQELVKGLTAASNPKKIASNFECLLAPGVTGKDYFACSSDVALEDLPEFLSALYRISKDDFSDEYKWFNQLQTEQDENVINELNEAVIDSLNSRDSRFSFAAPRVIEWENVERFTVEKSGYDAETFPSSAADVLGEMELESFEELESIVICAVGDEGVVHRWKASECLEGEHSLENEDAIHCICEEVWYRVAADYAEEVKQFYLSHAKSSDNLVLSCGSRKTEGEFNEDWCAYLNQNGEEALLLDKECVSASSGHSQVEVCDILLKNGVFVHVKKSESSSGLSYVFNQALSSAELMMESEVFRNGAREKVSHMLSNDQSDSDCASNSDRKIDKDAVSEYLPEDYPVKTVVFGIISETSEKDENGKTETNVPHIPFMGKLIFRNTYIQLHRYGIDVKTDWIKWEKSARININGTRDELEEIPSLSKLQKEGIWEYRRKNGNYSHINDITNVAGIASKTFRKIRKYITV